VSVKNKIKLFKNASTAENLGGKTKQNSKE
jgi:hypothetical protein